MSSFITSKLRSYNSGLLMSALTSGSDNVYLFIGKTDPWVDDTLPPSLLDSTFNNISLFKNITNLKKLDPTQVSLAIKATNWISGTVYTQYDDSVNLFDPFSSFTPFYILTDLLDVYKCISNNKGSPSLVKPTGHYMNTFKTGDNYIWKYMYTVSGSDFQNYATNDFIPIKKLTSDDNSLQWQVQKYAVPGTIENIRIDYPGTGYLTAPIATVIGDGNGAVIEVDIVNNQISNVRILNTGQGYTQAVIQISGNAVLTPIMSPQGGHGSDPVNELGGFYIIIHSQIISNESGIFSINSKFRQLGLLLNPLLQNGLAANGLKYSQAQTYTLSNVTGTFSSADLFTTINGKSGVVLDYNTSTHVLNVVNLQGIPLAVGDTLTINGSVFSGVIATIVKGFPDLSLFSGQILHMENIKPITRLTGQTQDIKMILEN